MIPKEKATELRTKFASILLALAPGQRDYANTISEIPVFAKLISDSTLHIHEQAKRCALFHCEEMIANEPGIRHVQIIDDVEIEWVEYWEKVKQEIQNL